MNHARLCAWLHVVSGVALLVLLSVGLAWVAAGYHEATLPIGLRSMLGTVALAVGTAVCLVAGLELIGGVAGLAGKPMARPLLLLAGAFHLINLPIGTALGVYTFWALLRNPGASAS